MRLHHIVGLVPLLLAACQQPDGPAAKPDPALAEAAAIARVVTLDYRARYTPDACLAPATTPRSGPEDIPHDLANRTVTWTYLARDANDTYEALDPDSAAAIDAVWQEARKGKYPSITLPAEAMPPRPARGCGKTLTLTSPMIAGGNAFVRWTDGTSRRTMALSKKTGSWAVVAEGPATIG